MITDIVYDSRKAHPGALYMAIPGTKVNGDTFIADAIARGAVAVLSENACEGTTVPWAKVRGIRALCGVLGRTLWCRDGVPAIVAGVTGTNGKTTIAHLLEGLFGMVYGSSRVWMFGTIDYHMGSTRIDASHTTPEAIEIYRHIGAAPAVPKALVMEVSSHSLALDRIGGLIYDYALFTNLTQDHLDFHGDMETYYLAKRRLFTDYLAKNGRAIVNVDDEYGKRLATEVPADRLITYGRSAGTTVRIASWECDWDGCRIEVVVNGTTLRYASKLRGFFNVYNMGALIGCGVAAGFDASTIQSAFDAVPVVNGRMDRVAVDLPFTVVVDYAHTPDALVNILRTAKEITRGRLLCVFGCGGDRDRKKRPIMGEAVARFCDEAWVTSDNPRSEEPKRIIEEIVGGIPLDFPFQTDPDRRNAIMAAMKAARPGDCLIVAGKGHENYQEIQGVKHHFDDKEIIAEISALLGKEPKRHGA
jgi:UDP-N-acetylmuramoyl-L-alanyl-D-glutamate--2,6-diaminopimelate ligase